MFKKTLLASAASLLLAGHTIADSFPKVTRLPDSLVAPASAELLSGADMAAVHETVTRIYLAEDSRNAEALKRLVTEDFIQDHSVYGRAVGPDEFARFLLDNPEGFDHYRHMSMNVVSRSTGPGTAEALSYVLVLEVHPDDEAVAAGLPRILAHGVVRDSLVKEDGQWRIAHRIYDQFAVTASVLPDKRARLNVARTIDAAQSGKTTNEEQN